MERHHPVTSQQEASVHIEVAAFIAVNLSAKGLHHLGLVEPFADPSELSVAQGPTILALDTDVVRVLSSALVRSDDSVVAIDCCWNA